MLILGLLPVWIAYVLAGGVLIIALVLAAVGMFADAWTKSTGSDFPWPFPWPRRRRDR